MLRSRFVRRPRPSGAGTVDHDRFDPILAALATDGIDALTEHRSDLATYIDSLAGVDPDQLDADGALAYWIDLYNALALDLAHRTHVEGRESVLHTRGGFTERVITVAGEELSLDEIEHGKIRRFGDPRIHTALVCGSASCPTLRHTAYRGEDLGAQLDEQTRHFLATGGMVVDRDREVVELSRVLLWHGTDFVRPHRMPTLVPARRRSVLDAMLRWVDPEVAEWVTTTRPAVAFQEYDWSLRCSVRPPAP